MLTFIAGFCTLLFCGSTASAHWGHLGELAGHGHWVAVGAALAAGALAAALAKKQNQKTEESADAASDEVDGEEETA